MLLQSDLDPADLKAHYNSYYAAGVISVTVYNPISIMSAFKRSRIENFTDFLLVVVFNFSLTEYFCYRQIPSLGQRYFRGLFPAQND